MTALKEKMDQMAVLSDKLDASLELQNYWPDLFEHGQCRAAPCKPADATVVNCLRVTAGNGEIRYIPVAVLDKGGLFFKKCWQSTPNPQKFKQRYGEPYDVY